MFPLALIFFLKYLLWDLNLRFSSWNGEIYHHCITSAILMYLKLRCIIHYEYLKLKNLTHTSISNIEKQWNRGKHFHTVSGGTGRIFLALVNTLSHNILLFIICATRRRTEKQRICQYYGVTVPFYFNSEEKNQNQHSWQIKPSHDYISEMYKRHAIMTTTHTHRNMSRYSH